MGSCNQYILLLRLILLRLTQNSSSTRLAIFVAIFFTIGFGEGSNSVHFTKRLATLIMISGEHWENNEISFQNVYGHREPVNLRIRGMCIIYCVCDFLFYRYPCMNKENIIAPEKMAFTLMIRDIPF